jgi:mannose-6-phosphate isomerase-like protein (cupin superfamily)
MPSLVKEPPAARPRSWPLSRPLWDDVNTTTGVLADTARSFGSWYTLGTCMQVIGTALLVLLAAIFPLAAQQAKASCDRCSVSYISREELDAYFKRAPERVTNSVSDQQVRAVDVGKGHVDVGVVYRNATQTEGSAVAEHDLVSEVYYILDGSATLVTGSDIVGLKPRPPDYPSVRLLNGPGGNGSGIRDGATYQLKAGDAIIIPAGVGHWFTKVDDHIRYIMIRIDPDKVTPTKDEAASKADLAGR